MGQSGSFGISTISIITTLHLSLDYLNSIDSRYIRDGGSRGHSEFGNGHGVCRIIIFCRIQTAYCAGDSELAGNVFKACRNTYVVEVTASA